MKGKVRIVVALFFMQFFLSATGAIAGPLAPAIGAALQVSNPALLTLMTTLPTLIMIPANLVSGFLGSRMSKKTIFYIGAAIYMVFSLAPIFATNITTFLVFRAIMGIGSGLIFPLGFAMLPDYFDGSAEQSASGIMNSGGLILAMPLAIIAGIIGGTSWQTGMWMYAFGIIPIILMATLVPNKKPEKVDPNAEEEKLDPPHPSAYVTAAALAVFYMGATVATAGIVFFLASTMDMATAASLGGLASAVFTFGGFLASLLYGKFYVWMGKWTGPVFFTIAALAFLFMFLFPGISTVFVGMFLVGACVGATGPFMIMGAMGKSYWTSSLVTGICIAGINLGTFLASPMLGALQSIFTGSWPLTFLGAGVIVFLVAIYTFIVAVLPEKD